MGTSLLRLLVADQRVGELNETQVEYLQDVLESGRNLLELINDIVEITKMDSLPKTATGKLDRKLLHQAAKADA